MVHVFEPLETVTDWKISLTSEAADLVGLRWAVGGIDQHKRWASLAICKVDPSRATTPLDLPGMLWRFLHEATNYTREAGFLPRQRVARLSPAKRTCCEAIALVANERLFFSGPFRHGVNTHDLRTVFAPLLDQATPSPDLQ